MIYLEMVLEEGSVENYTNRCIFAILDIEKDFVMWPTASERINIKRRAHPDDPFRNCVGYVDGTIIELAAAPVIHKEDYWMRKLVYGVNSLLVCDVDKRIIYGVHGWCGSAHDQRVYQSANVSLISFEAVCNQSCLTCTTW
jgi:hypothetical protein